MLVSWFVRKLLRSRRDSMLHDFHRVLPANELLGDRWEKARYLNFGDGSSIYDSSLVFGEVKVGRNTWIGPFTILDGTGSLTIGSHCSISAGVHIYTHNTVRWALSGGKDPYEYKGVTIGDSCFIGPHSTIQNGVTIGKHCAVSANSFVNQDVPDFTIVGGNPAQRLGRVKINKHGAASLAFSDTRSRKTHGSAR